MAFKKYSTAQLDLVGDEIPDWVDEEEDKKQKVASSETVETDNQDKKDK